MSSSEDPISEKAPPETPGAGFGGIPGADPVPVFIFRGALDEVMRSALRRPNLMQAGFLLGNPYRHLGRTYVEIRRCLSATGTRAAADSVTFTEDTWRALCEAKQMDESVVGWYLSQPGPGVYLSGQNLELHRRWFSEFWQVILIVEPESRRLGFFSWNEGRVVPCGFFPFM